MKIFFKFIFILIISLSSVNSENGPDILKKILGEVGFTREDIGFTPQGNWSRFPLDIPYRLSSFNALFAHPFQLYDYARLMGNVVETYLDPAYADSNSNGLYKMTYNLGVDKRLGGFRDYSANLREAPDTDNPLVTAFENLYALADRQTEFITFGKKADWPDINAEITSKTEQLPDTVKTILAGLIVNLTDAIKWRNKAFRSCDPADMQAAMNIYDLAETQGDGMVYYEVLDDLARDIDLPSLHYAALKIAAASERAELALKPFIKQIPDDFELEINTPFGKVAVFSPVYLRDKRPTSFFASIRSPRPDWMEYDASNSLLIVDFGRQMIYQGEAASSSLKTPVSVILDLGGDDYYGYEKTHYPPNAGVGRLGIGLVLDSDGDDHYNGSIYSQGGGLFGVGILYDRKGNDRYKAEVSAQGAGYFGIGLCLDGTGDDEFYLFGDGQGMGGIGGGVGVLASFEGTDKYTAEPYSDVFNRGDYHSQMKINANNAQGAGFGRRGDGSDGHAWAGGLGAIIDIHGNDHYYSGNWSLGIGYWFATGIVYDKYGNDKYESCYFTQGSGAHYCNGILIDEAGDDSHELFETAGAGLGFGWDFTNAFLINKGGNDKYRAKIISMGLAQIRSNAFLIDIGGDDEYALGKGTSGLGEATFLEDYRRPGKFHVYNLYVNSFGGFIDIGGTDKYITFDDEGERENSETANNSIWFKPARTDTLFGNNNYGVGIDVENGTVLDFVKWDVK